MGDRILKVNETDVTTATHQEAVMELLRPGDEIKLTIQHDPLPVGFQVSAKQSSANIADHSFLASVYRCCCRVSFTKRESENTRVHSSLITYKINGKNCCVILIRPCLRQII